MLPFTYREQSCQQDYIVFPSFLFVGPTSTHGRPLAFPFVISGPKACLSTSSTRSRSSVNCLISSRQRISRSS